MRYLQRRETTMRTSSHPLRMAVEYQSSSSTRIHNSHLLLGTFVSSVLSTALHHVIKHVISQQKPLLGSNPEAQPKGPLSHFILLFKSKYAFETTFCPETTPLPFLAAPKPLARRGTSTQPLQAQATDNVHDYLQPCQLQPISSHCLMGGPHHPHLQAPPSAG